MPSSFTKVLEETPQNKIPDVVKGLVTDHFENPADLIELSEAMSARISSAHLPLRLFPPYYSRPFQERSFQLSSDEQVNVKNGLELEIAELLSLSLIEKAKIKLADYKQEFGTTPSGCILETSLAWMTGELSLRDIFPGGKCAIAKDSSWHKHFDHLKAKIYDHSQNDLREFHWREIHQRIQMTCGSRSLDEESIRFIQSSVICALTASHIHEFKGFAKYDHLRERIQAYAHILPNPRHLKSELFPGHTEKFEQMGISAFEFLWDKDSPEYKELLKLRPQTFQWEDPESERILTLDDAWMALLELRGGDSKRFSIVTALGISFGKSLLYFAVETIPDNPLKDQSLSEQIFGDLFRLAEEKQRDYVSLNPNDPCSDKTIRGIFIIELLLQRELPLNKCGLLPTWLKLAEIPEEYAALAAWHLLDLENPDSRQKG